MLTKIVRISSVSGGSIANGMLAAAWPRLKISNGIITNLDAEVIAPLRAFCTRSVDTLSVGWGALLPGKSIGDVLADTYDDLFKGITLQDLPDSPQFVFNATNLKTGRLVRMMKKRLGDYTIGEVPRPNVRLAVAVAASSAFPPVLSPVEIDIAPGSWHNMPGTRYFGDSEYMNRLSLTDGGAYDNLGLETVDDFNPVIVSDAGAPFSTEESASALWPKQIMRAFDIATDQARALRKRLLFARCDADKRKRAYSGIDKDFSDDTAPTPLKASPDMIHHLARMRTRLDPFNEREQHLLINWGWLRMDVALRNDILAGTPAPTRLPFPNAPLG